MTLKQKIYIWNQIDSDCLSGRLCKDPSFRISDLLGFPHQQIRQKQRQFWNVGKEEE
jgi:hypothetical protein